MGQIKKVETHKDYKEVVKKSEAKDENNDCAVKAISIVTKVDYDIVHKILKDNGRKDKDGTYRQTTHKSLKQLGWKMELLDKRQYLRRFPKHHSELKYITSHSFRRFPEAFNDLPKVVLAFTASHVFAVMDSQNADWSVNNKLRIKGLYKLVPDWEQITEENKGKKGGPDYVS